jgi:hypothetical protein
MDNQQINETEQDISDCDTEEDSSTHQENVVDALYQEPATGSLMDLKNGQVVKYRNVQDGENCVAKVIGRAGKATGKHRNWYNMSCLEPESHKGAEISVDLSKVQELEICENDNVFVLNDVSFDQAKQKELLSWKNNNVYVEKKDVGQKCVSTRWICSLKDTFDGTLRKARLVARGFEEIRRDDLQKDSPTCGSDSLRLILTIMAQRQWQIHTMDIKTAFLQGSEIDREIYVRPPPEADQKGIVWQLRKCVYGLSDASLSWYNRVKDVLVNSGAEVSKADPAVFYWKNKQDVEGILVCHVNDFLWGGSPEFEKTVISRIRTTFLVGKEDGEENKSFSYVGIEMSRGEDGIELSQKNYQENIKFIPIEKIRLTNKEDGLKLKEKEILQSRIGQILWIARQSRPDIICDASNLASNLKNATVQTFDRCQQDH